MGQDGLNCLSQFVIKLLNFFSILMLVGQYMISTILAEFLMKLATRTLSESLLMLAKHWVDLLLSVILIPLVTTPISFLQALDIMRVKPFTISYQIGLDCTILCLYMPKISTDILQRVPANFPLFYCSLIISIFIAEITIIILQ